MVEVLPFVPVTAQIISGYLGYIKAEISDKRFLGLLSFMRAIFSSNCPLKLDAATIAFAPFSIASGI